MKHKLSCQTRAPRRSVPKVTCPTFAGKGASPSPLWMHPSLVGTARHRHCRFWQRWGGKISVKLTAPGPCFHLQGGETIPWELLESIIIQRNVALCSIKAQQLCTVQPAQSRGAKGEAEQRHVPLAVGSSPRWVQGWTSWVCGTSFSVFSSSCLEFFLPCLN